MQIHVGLRFQYLLLLGVPIIGLYFCYACFRRMLSGLMLVRADVVSKQAIIVDDRDVVDCQIACQIALLAILGNM